MHLKHRDHRENTKKLPNFHNNLFCGEAFSVKGLRHLGVIGSVHGNGNKKTNSSSCLSIIQNLVE
jgi:hypothetical protein